MERFLEGPFGGRPVRALGVEPPEVVQHDADVASQPEGPVTGERRIVVPERGIVVAAHVGDDAEVLGRGGRQTRVRRGARHVQGAAIELLRQVQLPALPMDHAAHVQGVPARDRIAASFGDCLSRR